MNPSGAIAHFRRREHQMMASTCTITRRDPEAEPVWNDATGAYEYPSLTIYSGKCRLAQPIKNPLESEAGGAPISTADFIVFVPLDTAVQIDDIVTVTGSADPAGDGLVLNVVGVPASDWQVVREIQCQVHTREPT